jgi:hypothetical protein
MKWTCTALAILALSATVVAQPAIDGKVDVLYGAPLVIQDTQTGFGDSNLGRPDIANGSELDAGYAVVVGPNLYIALAGNLESNGNKLEIFLDTRAGGQNRLLATNPGVANTKLLRMSDDGTGNGLKFDAGFEADFWVTVNVLGDPATVYADYAELYVDAGNPGVIYYAGAGSPTCTTSGGALTGGDAGAPAILATVNNSNRAGVSGGYGISDGSGVTTGVEVAIPLAALGNPTGPIRVCAFINGQQHDWVSNQALGGNFGTLAANPAEPRAVDFSTIYGDQFFTVPLSSPALGACCTGGACEIKTQADCLAGGGTYKGDNSECPAACDPTAGRCCIDDGYSGTCSVTTAAECAALGGAFGGAGTTCSGCPCLIAPKGACCVSGGCAQLTEADCTAAGGAYAGNYTNCANFPCDSGACCTNAVCEVKFQFQCNAGGGRFLGVGITCLPGLCDYTITTPYLAGDFNNWNAGDPAYAMPETPAGSHVYKLDVTLDPNTPRHEFKITRGDWTVNVPGSNAWVFAEADGVTTFTYDANYYADGWYPQRDRILLAAGTDPGTYTAVGSFQSEISAADWNNADPNTVMTAQGGGVYLFQNNKIPPGTYMGKATRTGSWDALGQNGRGTDASNWNFTVANTGDNVKIWADYPRGVTKVEVIAAPTVKKGDMNCDGVVDFKDINPFVAILSGSTPCKAANADTNCDNVIDFKDINPFVALLSGGTPCN